jgi:hypothetical protein
MGLWERLMQRIATAREVWFYRGVITLSPRTQDLWNERNRLEDEIEDLRGRCAAAQEDLHTKTEAYWEERLR